MYLQTAAETLTTANTLFRAIVRVQLVITILSELYSLETYGSRQPSMQLLSTLRSSEDLKAIQDLCALQRACVLTNVQLKASLPASAKPPTPFNASSGEQPAGAETPAVESAQGDVPSLTLDQAAVPLASAEQKDWPEAKLKNAKALKTVLSVIPDSLRYFLQGERDSVCMS